MHRSKSCLLKTLGCTVTMASLLPAQAVRPAAGKDAVVARLDIARPDYADPKTRRLEILAQIWGNIALFHPIPSAQRMRWDDVLVEAVDAVRDVRSDRDFANVLNRVVFAPLRDPLAYATTIADQRAAVTLPPALTRQWLSAGTAYVSAVNRVYAGPYHAPDFAQRLRAVTDTLARERRLERLIVDLRSTSGVYYREGMAGLWLGMWLRETTRLGMPLSIFRDTEVGDLSEVKWLVSPRDSLVALGPPIGVPTVFLVNRTSYGAGERAIDAVRAGRTDVAVLLEASGRIPNLGYNGFQAWYPDSLLLPHGRIPIVSADGGLGSIVDAIVPSIQLDQLDNSASEALAARRAQTQRAAFSFADARIADDTVSVGPLTREQRIAGLLKIWYWVGHFYAYLDDATTIWQRLISDWLQRVEAATDPAAYYLILEEIGALLQDNHTWVTHPLASHAVTGNVNYVPPVYVIWVADRVAIVRTDTSTASLGVAPGDEILTIDSLPVLKFEREQRRYRSISRPRDRVRAQRMLWGAKDTPINFEIRTRTGIRKFTLNRTIRAGSQNPLGQWNHPPFEMLPGNIGYLNVGKLNSPQQDSALAVLADARGLILDDRSGPPSNLNLFRFLFATAPHMTPVHSIVYQHGSYSPMRALGSGRFWDVPALERDDRKFRGPIVVLTAGDKQSTGESLAILLRINGRATFVGESTNGTTGSLQQITLPGGARLGFSGNAFLFPNGQKYHGVGIIPDVPVKPTFAGLRAQRDEVFERGVTAMRAILEKTAEKH